MKRLLEQSYAIIFCIRLKKSTTKVFEMLQQAFGDVMQMHLNAEEREGGCAGCSALPEGRLSASMRKRRTLLMRFCSKIMKSLCGNRHNIL